ncbi:amidase [Enterobacteriaceae bacterium H20N1]|uniref:Amidase n=1 Tax=Dryocola boscaweniae TaxID=2925397 RepID=A0A9X2WAZ4_9ENTR|nr:amidase [Dryocola boscaweniae]MCT4704184.1 amidase [Dryocola boscaweniae]MCT4721352.1 amidase [Dryocola boscaweniae]
MKAMCLKPVADCRDDIASRLDAIETNSPLNAILGVNPDAIALAEHCYRAARRGITFGPLHGLPIIIKDNIACAGMPITLGCRGLASLRAACDSLAVQRLRDAGAIIFARANMSEFAFDVRSRSSLGGDVRNPLQPEITAGGSSGGCAAAVAAGMADGALGTDTGGSIRIPASYNGLVGLRPAYRREMLEGVAPLSLSKDTVGPMAHTVRDAALLHAIIHGHKPAPLQQIPLSGLRLGVISGLEGNDEAQGKVWHAALDTLQRAGAAIVSVTLPELETVRQTTCLSVYEFRVAFDAWLKGYANAPAGLAAIFASEQFLPEFSPFITRLLEENSLKSPEWLAGRRFRRRLRQRLGDVLVENGLQGLLYPTVNQLPISLEKMPPGCAPELAAISGLPALTLPCGISSRGLPVGMEILSGRRDEALLLSVALACETALNTSG